MIRSPVVAGKFYSADKDSLEKQLTSFLPHTAKKKKIACIMPHAGYMYSGLVAAQTAAAIEIPENIILLGPNHTGVGNPFSIISQGAWQTPLGSVTVHSQIAESLKANCSLIKEDESAHAYEHSLEVQLPILQFLREKEFRFVPLVVMSAEKHAYRDIADAIDNTITALAITDTTLIIASSDMTHYESQESAKKKDTLAIEAILNLDEDLLLKRVAQYDISICGYIPIAITIMAAKKLGAKNAELIKYQTSGEASGDYNAVVGYAGIVIS